MTAMQNIEYSTQQKNIDLFCKEMNCSSTVTSQPLEKPYSDNFTMVKGNLMWKNSEELNNKHSSLKSDFPIMKFNIKNGNLEVYKNDLNNNLISSDDLLPKSHIVSNAEQLHEKFPTTNGSTTSANKTHNSSSGARFTFEEKISTSKNKSEEDKNKSSNIALYESNLNKNSEYCDNFLDNNTKLKNYFLKRYSLKPEQTQEKNDLTVLGSLKIDPNSKQIKCMLLKSTLDDTIYLLPVITEVKITVGLGSKKYLEDLPPKLHKLDDVMDSKNTDKNRSENKETIKADQKNIEKRLSNTESAESMSHLHTGNESDKNSANSSVSKTVDSRIKNSLGIDALMNKKIIITKDNLDMHEQSWDRNETKKVKILKHKKKRKVKGEKLKQVYSCDFPNCNYTTTNKLYNQRHIIQHTKKRIYHCHICGLGFNQIWRFEKHMNHTHYEEFNAEQVTEDEIKTKSKSVNALTSVDETETPAKINKRKRICETQEEVHNLSFSDEIFQERTKRKRKRAVRFSDEYETTSFKSSKYDDGITTDSELQNEEDNIEWSNMELDYLYTKLFKKRDKNILENLPNISQTSEKEISNICLEKKRRKKSKKLVKIFSPKF